jgi:hypothetical protein
LVQAAIDRANEIDGHAALSKSETTRRFAEFQRAVNQVHDSEITLRDRVTFDSLQKYQLDIEYQPNAGEVHKADRALLERMIGHKQN